MCDLIYGNTKNEFRVYDMDIYLKVTQFFGELKYLYK